MCVLREKVRQRRRSVYMHTRQYGLVCKHIY